MIGRDLMHDPSLGFAERLYVRFLGAPISGLRVRCRRILPQMRRVSGRILDVGSGTGTFTFEVARRNPACTVVGVETDPRKVAKGREIARRAGLSNCTFETGNALALGYDGEFDFGLCVDILEHIDDDILALSNLKMALKPGKPALIHVPAYERTWVFFGRSVNFDVEGHVRPGYRREEFRRKLEAAGFLIEELRYTYGWLETVANNLSYLITGADMKNKYLYALAFPLLNAIAWLGRRSTPVRGAGLLARVRRPLR